MASVTAPPITLEEFLAKGDIHYYDFHELHHGEIVVVSGPTVKHVNLQERLQDLLRSSLDPSIWFTGREFFMTLPTEARRADLAVVERRVLQEQLERTFFGAPKLIVEVLSPSNTYLDVNHLRAVTLAQGTWQFWVVDMDLQEVMVYMPGGQSSLYTVGMKIRLDEFQMGAMVPVDAIFESPRP